MSIVERIAIVSVWGIIGVVILAILVVIISHFAYKRMKRIEREIEQAIALGADSALRYRLSHFCLHHKELKRIIRYLKNGK